MYTDYAYYADVYYGTIVPEEDYQKYESRASDFINYITWGRAKEHADLPEVKKCSCALAEQYMLIDGVRVAAAAKVTEDGIIASESVGSHSRSFRTGADATQAVAAEQAELTNIVRRYLLPTGLLYRGVNSCVHASHGHAL